MLPTTTVNSDEFDFTGCPEALVFCDEIIDFMVQEFNIERPEALGRLNRGFKRWVHVGDGHILFHETEKYWAYCLYFGKDSRWWQNPPGLTPLPYP
jgi:hypothetical protein